MNSLRRIPRTFSHLHLLGALTIGALALSSCGGGIHFAFDDEDVRGTGNVTTQTHETAEFDHIDICCGLDVAIEFDDGPGDSVAIAIDDNLHAVLEVEVSNGTLHVRPIDDTSLSYSGNLVLTVHGQDIVDLDVSAGSYVQATIPPAEEFRLDVDAGSTVAISVDVEHLAIDADAGGVANIRGTAVAVDAHAGAGSEILLTALEGVIDATADASAGSSIEVEVSGELTGKASAGSEIDVWGDPTTLDVETDLSSDVNRN